MLKIKLHADANQTNVLSFYVLKMLCFENVLNSCPVVTRKEHCASTANGRKIVQSARLRCYASTASGRKHATYAPQHYCAR